jgi:hypothetical protein
VTEDERAFFRRFAVEVGRPGLDPAQEYVDWCAQENDRVELRVEAA